MSVAYDLLPWETDADWHGIRATGIGASDAAAAIGLDPYKTPYALWLEKTGLVEPPDLSQNEAVQMGNRLESTVADIYSERTGRKVVREPRTLHSRNYPFMLANIDRRVVGEKRGLECKTAGFWAGQSEEWGDPDNVADAVPLRYHCQCTHSIIVSGWPEWDLAVLVAGQRLGGPYTIRLDPELADMIVKREAAFWERVVNARAMLATGADEKLVQERWAPPAIRTDDLKVRYRDSVSSPITATPDVVKRFDDMLELRNQREGVQSEIDGHELAIKAFMGEHDELRLDSITLATWRTSKPRATFDSQRHAKEHPDCHKAYAGTAAPSRPFNVKEPA